MGRNTHLVLDGDEDGGIHVALRHGLGAVERLEGLGRVHRVGLGADELADHGVAAVVLELLLPPVQRLMLRVRQVRQAAQGSPDRSESVLGCRNTNIHPSCRGSRCRD